MPSTASIHRTLALRTRPDLLATAVESAGAAAWVVKDPLTLEHFQFSAEEYALLDWLRQPATISELQRRFAEKFPPQTIGPEAVWEFISRLHDSGLAVSTATGQGNELLNRRRQQRNKRWSFAWTGLLAMRFRGIDPDRLLSIIHANCRWLFSKTAAAVALGIVALALSILIGHFSEFSRRLPELSALFEFRNLPWLLLAIGSVKVLHELGHGLACKHFGGEVRELGFMLLVFAPCLYCDVSDAWRLPSRWQRMAVSGAGIVVEVVLAALATIVWWYAQPGVVQLLALNIMVVCSLNTLVVNGNPLLRYDGYYVLADLVNVPNLWIRSREALSRYMGRWFIATKRNETNDDPLVPATQRPWLAAYALASKTYLTLVFVGIVWGLITWLHPYRLDNVAYFIGCTVVASALVSPVTTAARLARNPIRRNQVRKSRVALAGTLALAAIVGILAIPVTYKVEAPVVLLPTDAARVAATTHGTLVSMLPVGSQVKRGDTIGQLANPTTTVEIARLEGEQRLRQLRVEHLERLRGIDREANDDLPTARAALADTERRLAELRSDAKRLTITAPTDGTILPAPRLVGTNSARATSPHARLATWSGTLLDEVNRGAYVEPGSLLCLVGNPSQLDAVMLVSDTDVKRLHPGQPARLQLEQLPGQIVGGEVVEVSRYELPKSRASHHGPEDLDSLLTGIVPPEQHGTVYQARVRFTAPPAQLITGTRGQAKVATERIPLARLLLRYLTQTFRLPA